MIERFNFRMTVKNGFCKCLLFVLLPEDDEKSKHGLLVFASSFPGLFSLSRALGTRLFVFPPKKTLIGKGIVRLANCITVWRQSEVSIDCYKVHTSSHARLYPFAKPMKSLYFRSFVVSVFFARFHFKVIDYFRIPHNTLCLPPKFCITYCLKMLLGKCNTPRSI